MEILKERGVGIAQFLTISAVALVVFIGWDFGHRVLGTIDLLRQDNQAQVRLQAATQVNQQLHDLKNHVTTDAWVEWYARNKWHWTRPDEVLVVPISSRTLPQPVNIPPAAPAPPAKAWWQQWVDPVIEAIFGPAS
ncbi:MAG: hypothetical protein WCF84_18080 [Anaerolineae bacterium]